MANCHKLFTEYHQEICIGTAKKDRMKGSKNALRKRIKKWFKENHPDYEPKFFIQGSNKMKTGIRTKEDICDLDDGIYFFRKPNITATTLQGWIWNAVNGYTENEPEHRKKCIRTIIAGDYEIDHPVYYKVDGQNYKIAVKDIGFEDSDPKAMIDWFQENKDNEGKIVKIVMYLKGWCDNLRMKMPSGLAMTILVVNAKTNIVLNDRDDITIRDILKEIRKTLNQNFKCVVPAVPNDDLFSDYDDSRIKNFLTVLDEFTEDADKALKEQNELVASILWRKHLGQRFPKGEDKKQDNTSRFANAVAVGAATSNPWAL